MDRTSSTTQLRRAARELGPLVVETRWFIYGSTLENDLGSDLDVLIVYDHGDHERAIDLMTAIEASDVPQPIEIQLLSAHEETDMHAIRELRAVQVV